MKKLIYIVFVLSAIITNVGCENEPYEGEIFLVNSENDPTIPENFENSFYAKLNGVEFLDQQIYTIISTDAGDRRFMAITGSENNYHSIIIYLPYDIVVGTHIFSPETILETPNLNITYSNLANLLESGVGDGYVTIDVHDRFNHYIKGHFGCVVTSQNGSINTITEGNFEIVYLQ